MGLPKGIFLAIISGVLFALASPGFLTPFLSFVFLVPFVYGSMNMAPARAFTAGLIGWAAGYGAASYWLLDSFISIYKINFFQSLFIFIAAALLFYGLYHGLHGVIISLAGRRLVALCRDAPGPRLFLEISGFTIIVSSAWGFIEYFRGTIFPGFNITTLAGFFYRVPFMIKGAAVLPEHLFSAAIVSVGVPICILIYTFVPGEDRVNTAKIRFHSMLSGALFIILFMAVVTAGNLARRGEEPPFEKGSVLVIQADIPAEKKWKPRYHREILERYMAMTDEYRTGRTRYVLWPETALNFYPQIESPLTARLREFQETRGITIFSGGPEFVRTGRAMVYYNAVFMVAGGVIRSVYRKEALVPFAEYCPVDFLLPLFRKVMGENQFTSFRNNVTVAVNGVRLGMAICFESTFPAVMADRAETADAVIVFSDDVWLGDTSGPLQHLATQVLRAVENRVWIISPVNSGISAVISPEGRVISELSFGEKGSITFP